MKMWAKRVVDKVHAMTSEDYAVACVGATFFVGIWYAFPMVNTITDVWPFGGGVLRALEAHTLLPGRDLAYGTLTFYQNYALMVIALGLSYVALGFDVEALKTILILNPSYSLIVPRVASALTAAVFLAFVYRFLRHQVPSASWRFALLILAFCNVLATILIRSGKMWMLSVGLGVASFIFVYYAITRESHGRPGMYAAAAIMTAFLAAANFAFAGIFLVGIPILVYVFPHTRDTLKRLSLMVVAGGVIFLALFALNATNTVAQVSGFITQFFDLSVAESARMRPALTFFESFRVNVRQAIESFPLLLFALVPAIFYGVRDKTLAALAVLYIAVYMFAVSMVFRADDGLALNVRHIFPIGFFLMFLLAACRPPATILSILYAGIGLAIYAYTLVLLSIPTTYNLASDFISERFSHDAIRIEESIFELTLPMNKASYHIYSDESCGSTCQYMRRMDRDIAFRPIVTTKDSSPIAVAGLPPPDLIIVDRAIDTCVPIARFSSGAPDDQVFDIDINLGRMLMLPFYRLERLGKNIYIYDPMQCAVPA